MRKVKLSWNMSADGVVEVSATDSSGVMFPVLDLYRKPLIERGGMTKEEAKAFQVFSSERICNAWNSDMTAADLAESHTLDPNLDLTEWGQGHNAACEQIAHVIRRRFEF